MPNLVAHGSGQSQHWQYTLSEGEVIRLGRSPRNGWKVPWDQKISREHVDLILENGRLTVRCLGTARNPIYFNQEQTRSEIELSIGQEFRIGSTSFQFIDDTIESEADDPLQEFSYRSDELEKFEFGYDRQRLNVLAGLPKLISTSRTDEHFANGLCRLAIQAIPKADAAAVMQYEDLASSTTVEPTTLCWKSRSQGVAEFNPSRRLVSSALRSGKSYLYIWPEKLDTDNIFTMSFNLDWAFCTPIGSDAQKMWCLYVSGRTNRGGSSIVSPDEIKGDLRFAQLLTAFISSIRDLKRLQQQRDEMSQFFSPVVIESLARLEKEDDALIPKEQDISVLFCDVRGFSRATEESQHDLHKLLARISSALGVMTKAIMRYEGVIADFQGDAALAFWGWPQQLDSGPASACRTALLMHKQFMQANQDKESSLAGFKVGIGIGHGNAIAGKIGTEEQCKVGVFGPVVNLTSRLEGMTKHFRVPILIDEQTADYVRDHFDESEARVRKLGRVRPQGMDAPLMVSELLPPEHEPGTISNQLLRDHERAVDLFIAGKWSEAFDLFEEMPVSNRARELLLLFMAHNKYSPPNDWDGIIDLDSK